MGVEIEDGFMFAAGFFGFLGLVGALVLVVSAVVGKRVKVKLLRAYVADMATMQQYEEADRVKASIVGKRGCDKVRLPKGLAVRKEMVTVDDSQLVHEWIEGPFDDEDEEDEVEQS